MASLKPHQVALLIPGGELPFWLARMSVQPCGAFPRKNIAMRDRMLVVQRAKEACQKQAISQRACDFLKGWAMGTLRREARPCQYEFLTHRVHRQEALHGLGPSQGPRQRNPRPIVVHRPSSTGIDEGLVGEALPIVPDEEEGQAELVTVPDQEYDWLP